MGMEGTCYQGKRVRLWKILWKKAAFISAQWFSDFEISVGMGMISMHCMMMGLPITGIRNYMSFWKGNPLSCQES